MLTPLTIFISIVAGAFLWIGRHEIRYGKWYRHYLARVLRISIPIAFMLASVLWVFPSLDAEYVFWPPIFILQIAAAIGFVMTGWLTLIFIAALIISTLSQR